MTGPEHYLEAQRLLESTRGQMHDVSEVLLEAATHASLAAAAAHINTTWGSADPEVRRVLAEAWIEVTSS